jgi:hypothetical protein
LVAFFVGLGIIPLVVRGDITCPEDGIRSHFIDLVGHLVNHRGWHIAEGKTSIITSLICWILRVSILGTAAKDVTTVFIRANCVV